MQDIFNLPEMPRIGLEDSDQKSESFSKFATEMPLAAYMQSTPGFWTEDELQKTLNGIVTNGSINTVTLSEWKLLSAAFLQLCMTRRAEGKFCDFLVIGTSWQNDETAVRHVSFGNWGTLTHQASYRDLFENNCSGEVECLSAEVSEALHVILREHGLIALSEKAKTMEATIFKINPYPVSTETICWKILAGGMADWDALTTDEPGKNYDDLACDDPHDEGHLTLVYINKDQNLVTRELTPLYTTEPKLVTDDNYEVTWNY